MTSPGGVEVSRISVRVLPDTSRLLTELEPELEKIERQISLDIRASVDTTELAASAREAVAEAQAVAGDFDIKAHVDTSQLGQAERVLSGAASSAASLGGSFSTVAAGAAALGLALVPLAAVVTGLVAALAAPLAITAGGVTVFGFLSGFAAKDAVENAKTIDKLQSKLGTLKKGTAEYATTLSQLRDAQASMTPAQSAFVDALDRLKGAFDSLPKGVLLKPLTDALGLLAQVLPDLTPIVKAVSGVFDDLVHNLSKVVDSPGFKSFIKAFAHDLGRDLKAFAKIAGNIGLGLGGLFGALDDTLSKGVLKGLEDITGKFADFGENAKKNEGLRSFVSYVKQNMPLVGQLLSGTFGLLSDIFSSLAEPAHIVLKAIDGIVGALDKLGDSAAPLVAALAGFGIGSLFGGPEVGLAVGGVLGLAGAFKKLYDRVQPLRDLLGSLWGFFKQNLLPIIQTAATQIMPALKGAVQDISDTIRDNQGFLKILGEAILALGTATVVGAIEQTALAIRGIGKAFKFGVTVAKLFANITLASFRLIVDGVKLVVNAILGEFGSIVDAQAAAFGWIPGIGGKIKAAQANFHAFADGVNGNLDSVSNALADLQRQINEVGKSHPRFHIDSNTLDLIKQMHEIQAFQFKDKHLKITTQIEQQIERNPGPGGGMNRPSSLRSGSGGGAGSGPLVNIENANVSDVNDLLRKAGDRLRARAGGGINLRPSPTPALGG